MPSDVVLSLILAVVVGSLTLWWVFRGRAGKTNVQVLFIDGLCVSMAKASYDSVKATLSLADSAGMLVWSVEDEARPKYMLDREPLMACVVGEQYARAIDIPPLSQRLKDAMDAAQGDDPLEHLSEGLREDLDSMGIRVREPLSAPLIRADGRFDNREYARMIDANLAEAFREPQPPTLPILLLGGGLGGFYTMMLARSLPPEYLYSEWMSIIVTIGMLALFGVLAIKSTDRDGLL